MQLGRNNHPLEKGYKSLLYKLSCLRPPASCLLPSNFYLVPSAFLPSAFCLLPSAFLPSAFCLLPSAFYLLPSAFRLPPSGTRAIADGLAASGEATAKSGYPRWYWQQPPTKSPEPCNVTDLMPIHPEEGQSSSQSPNIAS